MSAYASSTNNDKWVVFSGQTELWWLWLLKPGFRHCYVIMNDGHRWVSVDPLSHMTDVAVHHHLPPDFDLPAWLESKGMRAIKVPRINTPSKQAPLSAFTCVEAVKRIIGLHAPLIYTPHQLFKRLESLS